MGVLWPYIYKQYMFVNYSISKAQSQKQNWHYIFPDTSNLKSLSKFQRQNLLKTHMHEFWCQYNIHSTLKLNVLWFLALVYTYKYNNQKELCLWNTCNKYTQQLSRLVFPWCLKSRSYLLHPPHSHIQRILLDPPSPWILCYLWQSQSSTPALHALGCLEDPFQLV